MEVLTQEPNGRILEDYRKKNQELKNNKYSELQIIELLNNIENIYIAYEHGTIDDKDIKENFLRAIRIVCDSPYLT